MYLCFPRLQLHTNRNSLLPLGGDPFFELVPSQGTSVRNKGNVKPSFPHFVPSQAGQPSSGLFRGTGFSLALLQALQSTKIIITLLLKERREKINS